ncbi:MAG TPA: cyclase family protein [Candidatus Limnocylindria bacterium]|nr:cyclase family protein [Candidatus Limnocylindria bacterium]
MVRLIEVSHRITAGMKTYPGLPEPTVDLVVDYESSRERYGGKAEFLIASLHLCGNTGTYVDSPHHRYRGGADLAELPLERLAHVPAVVIDATRAGRAIGPEAFAGGELAGKAVLVRTEHSRNWGSEAYFTEHPFLTAESADLLVRERAVFVGIDSLNIDDTADLARPAHSKLLGAGIPVCEHLTNLAAAAGGGRLHAVPIAWVGGATFPVRAYVVAE